MMNSVSNTASMTRQELLERIAALEAKLAQLVPTEPAKTDHRKLQLQGLILAAVRLGLAQPSEALLHQLDRLIDFYEDDKFADALRLLRHSVRNPKPAGRRIPLVPSAAPAAPEQQEPKILQRADDLHNKAGMPWDEAEKLALEEAGIGDAEIDELIGNCSPDAVVSLLNEEDVRVFSRSILVHQHGMVAQAKPEQAAQQWMPIETAPTGEKVLMFSPDFTTPSVGDWGHYCKHNHPNFTHWMPLPAAPQPKD